MFNGLFLYLNNQNKKGTFHNVPFRIYECVYEKTIYLISMHRILPSFRCICPSLTIYRR